MVIDGSVWQLNYGYEMHRAKRSVGLGRYGINMGRLGGEAGYCYQTGRRNTS
jgi:hypothetical protein